MLCICFLSVTSQPLGKQELITGYAPVCPRYEGYDIRDKGLCMHGVDSGRSNVQVKHTGCQQVIGAGREREAVERSALPFKQS